MSNMKKRIFIGIFGLSAGLLGIEWGLAARESAKYSSSSTPSEEDRSKLPVETDKGLIDIISKQRT